VGVRIERPSSMTTSRQNEKIFAGQCDPRTLDPMTPNDETLEEARRAGFDLNLIDSNLALSPEQRALRHDSALELAQALKEAGAAHAQSALTPTTVR
jgi:hypothetical protein